jgi:purine-nucleoside phosphorylase
MTSTDLHTRANEAAAAISAFSPEFPKTAVVLGSGLGAFAENLGESQSLGYASIPHFPPPTVAGHRGALVVGTAGSARVAVLQGRFHYYEGHDLESVTFPVRVLRALGVETLILTAATGGIRADLRPGDVMALSDHLNLFGANPLRGPNDERLGLRFPDMTEVYSPRLRSWAVEEAKGLGINMPTGVYACMPGPSYEPAEIRMLRTLGADVVGMSTVPEAIVARHSGMEVLALAIVSNWAAGIGETPITHEEVLEAGRQVEGKLASLLSRVLVRISSGERGASAR